MGSLPAIASKSMTPKWPQFAYSGATCLKNDECGNHWNYKFYSSYTLYLQSKSNGKTHPKVAITVVVMLFRPSQNKIY